MTIRFSYYADLSSIQLDESGKGWIQAMRVGEYQHPVHGKLSFTSDRLRRFAENVVNRVRGIDLDIDYDHKSDPSKGNEAAGWVRDAKVDGDALWVLVEWTKTAASKIKERAYRYFSPDFQDTWTDASGKTHQDVLFGGGITNRPFLKDLLPLNLSELSFAEPKKEKGMDLKELRKLYGLPEDGSQDDQILERAQADRNVATSKAGTPPDHTATTHAPNNPASDTPTVPGGPNDSGKDDKDKAPPGAPHPASFPQQHAASLEVELSELFAKNPALKRLMETVVAPLQTRLAELEKTNHLSGINVKLTEFRTGAKVVAPAILDEFAAILANTPVQLHEKIYGVLRKMQGGNDTIQLGETALGGQPGQQLFEGKSVDDEVMGRTKKLMETNKELSEGDAFVQVMAEDPALFSAYQESSYLFKA